MITDITKADTAKDVSQYAAYLFNPKPGHKDYIHGERVLATSSDFLLGDGKEQVKHLLLWNTERRIGKAPPKSQALVGSIAFHPDDKLSPDEAIEVARKAVHRVMGDDRPVIYVAHGDTEHLHVHIIAATVNSKGTIYAKRLDFRDWEHANEELEIEYGLTRVKQRKSEAKHDATREVLVSAPSNAAMQMAEKGILTPKEELRGYIDTAYATGDFSTFLTTLDTYEVRVKPNIASTGAVSGMSFALASDPPGMYLKASDFGKAFAWKKLSETLHYDKDKHLGELASRKLSADAYDAGIDRNSAEIRAMLEPHGAGAKADERPVTAKAGTSAQPTAAADGAIERGSSADRSTTGRGLGDPSARGQRDDAPATHANRGAPSPSITVMGAGREIDEPIAGTVARGRDNDEPSSQRPSAAGSQKIPSSGTVDRLDGWSTSDRIRAMADAVKGGVTSTASGNADTQPKRPLASKPLPVDQVHSRPMRSFERARASIERQVKALGRAIKDMVIGIRGTKGVREEKTDTLSDDYLTHLRGENANGKHIYIKPQLDDLDRSDIILLDDITLANIDRMEKNGIPVACVIESSPNKYQAWVRFPAPLFPEQRTHVSRNLTREYECDVAAIGNDRWGRLAGFTNTKEERRLANGQQPFVQVRSSSGRIVEHAMMMQLVSASEDTPSNAPKQAVTPSKGINEESRIAKEFTRLYEEHKRKNPALGASELDFAVAIELLKHNHADDVAAAMAVASPNIENRKTGHVADYVTRTVEAAASRLKPQEPGKYQEGVGNVPKQSRGDAIRARAAQTAAQGTQTPPTQGHDSGRGM